MEIFEIDAVSCKLLWSQEIEPEIYADAIHQGMLISIGGLKKVLSN